MIGVGPIVSADEQAAEHQSTQPLTSTPEASAKNPDLVVTETTVDDKADQESQPIMQLMIQALLLLPQQAASHKEDQTSSTYEDLASGETKTATSTSEAANSH